ncbi:hypothetical protein GXM_02010 [Nostoc sphaeroides CCNUC1]|uniref:Uncharacterized protein n=1 Tax=Nostoc sphaeroides CCNUC1 TaxID=2653204 RepID=A0A5P8VVV1_9NOSO|nr:hypothetical protein GXM_02010 [Nostoc sphaeroides CCNUC1]
MAIRPSVKKQEIREQGTGGEFLYNLSPLQEQHPSSVTHLFTSTIINFNYLDDYRKDFII